MESRILKGLNNWDEEPVSRRLDLLQMCSIGAVATASKRTRRIADRVRPEIIRDEEQRERNKKGLN